MGRTITDALKTEGLVGMRGRGKFRYQHRREFVNFEIIAIYSNGNGIVTRLAFFDNDFSFRQPGSLECPLDSIRDYSYKGRKDS